LIHVIFGRRGTGKTCLARSLANEYDPARLVIADPFGHYGDFKDRGARLVPRLTPELLREPHKSIVIDELRVMLYDWRLMQTLAESLAVSRHTDQDYILATHRPAFITREVTALADVMYLFQTTEKKDLDFFGSLPGITPEIIAKIQTLETRHYWKQELT